MTNGPSQSEDTGTPGYMIQDPAPIAAKHPYTFLIPADEVLQAIRPGDALKFVFLNNAPQAKYEAERMWVEVREISNGTIEGVLDNEPSEIAGMTRGMPISAPLRFAVATGFQDESCRPPAAEGYREYWDQCCVDGAILSGDSQIVALYRDEPQDSGPRKPADSGWLIATVPMGTDRSAVAAEAFKSVAIGAVLKKDDSWLHLIDAPVGSAFERDCETGAFLPCQREA
ncbi:MAG: DUF2185 domain-containing protein [Pseudomonadota bacterium]